MAALLQEALALHRRGELAEAAARYKEVLRTEPGNADAHYYLGMMACQEGRFVEGYEFARKTLASDPRHARGHVLLGRALSALGRQEEALESFKGAIAAEPDLAPAHSHLADILSDLGRKTEAIESYDHALALAPDAVDDWFNRGLALLEVGRPADAVGSFDRVIAGKPEFARAHLQRAKALSQLTRHGDALASADKALGSDPGLAEAWLDRGNILCEFGRHAEAIESYDRALALEPDLVAGWLNRAATLIDLGRCNEAVASFDRAIAIKSYFAPPHLLRAKLMLDLRRREEALAGVERALALEPRFADAWLCRANILSELKLYDEATAACDRALALQPDLAEAWLGRGNIAMQVRRYDEAFSAYDKALTLKPDLDYVAGSRLAAKLFICDWTDFAAERARLLAAGNGAAIKKRGEPFDMARITDDRAILLETSIDWAGKRSAHPAVKFKHTVSPRGDKPRLAYMSQDFRQHVTGMNYVDLFEQHDRSRFELFGFSLAPNDGSATHKRIAAAFDRFHDLSAAGDEAAAQRIRELGIDVIVEMVPHSSGSRPAILAHRPAPVQVNGWSAGYSAGATHIDYILGDPRMLPLSDQPFFLEKIVNIPHTCFPHDSTQAISPRTPTRREEGLPESGFVFCCFSASYKLTPDFFAVWMRLLERVPGSVLWLARNNDHAAANLRREARARGVDPDRLVFAAHRPALEDHLARHRLADLFLDTLPYNAQSTSMDALWAGLPVLTCAGRSYAGRFAMTQLHDIGLSELVAEDLAAYERIALELARDPQRLREIKARLERNRLTTPLFDTKRLCHELETAYETMLEIWRRGESPRSFSVGLSSPG